MITTDAGFVSFSHAANDRQSRCRLRDDVVVGMVRKRTKQFLGQYGPHISFASNGLLELLWQWCDAPASTRQVLQTALILKLVQGNASDPVWASAQFAAGLNSQDVEGDWSASFASPAALAFGWRPLPHAQQISVSAHRRESVICTDGGPMVPVVNFPEAAMMFEFAQSHVPILGAKTQSFFRLDQRAAFANVPETETVDALKQTGELLHRYAPEYLGWIEDIISAFVPIARPGAEFFQSFSLPSLCGVVFVSLPAPALKIAELLVHECSHQYYHVAQFATEFSNGRDERLYYSPYVNENRPINRILMAYHAFANVVLFYRSCLQLGMHDSCQAAQGEIEFNMTRLRSMSADLERTPGLTPAGRGLFERLRDELFR